MKNSFWFNQNYDDNILKKNWCEQYGALCEDSQFNLQQDDLFFNINCLRHFFFPNDTKNRLVFKLLKCPNGKCNCLILKLTDQLYCCLLQTLFVKTLLIMPACSKSIGIDEKKTFFCFDNSLFSIEEFLCGCKFEASNSTYS